MNDFVLRIQAKLLNHGGDQLWTANYIGQLRRGGSQDVA